MSFKILNNGRFSPIELPSYHNLKTDKTKPGETEFKIEDSPANRPSNFKLKSAVNAYKKQKQNFELEHSIFYAKDIMSSPVHTIDLKATRTEIKQMMAKYSIGHIPVFDANTLVGLITLKDLLKSDSESASGIMTKEVVTALEQATVQDIAKIMLSFKIHCLPIINDRNQLCGIITEKDLLRLLAERFHSKFWA